MERRIRKIELKTSVNLCVLPRNRHEAFYVVVRVTLEADFVLEVRLFFRKTRSTNTGHAELCTGNYWRRRGISIHSMRIVTINTFDMIRHEARRIFGGIMNTREILNVMSELLQQLRFNIGCCNIAIVTSEAIIFFRNVIQQSLRLAGIVRYMAVPAGIFGNSRVFGGRPRIGPCL